MASILVVEDDPNVRELVAATLELSGHDVELAEDGPSGLAAGARAEHDLVVLDVGLPGMNGWEVCRELRAHTDVPILFLTAFADEASTVHGLQLGADDYLSKPFSPNVFAARVEALLRRSRPQGQTPARPAAPLQVGGLYVDAAAAEVRREGQPVHVTPSELRMLTALAQRPGEVLSSRELVRAAQGYEVTDAEAYKIAKVHIRRLRQKLEPRPEEPRYILNARGLGYRLARETP